MSVRALNQAGVLQRQQRTGDDAEFLDGNAVAHHVAAGQTDDASELGLTAIDHFGKPEAGGDALDRPADRVVVRDAEQTFHGRVDGGHEPLAIDGDDGLVKMLQDRIDGAKTRGLQIAHARELQSVIECLTHGFRAVGQHAVNAAVLLGHVDDDARTDDDLATFTRQRRERIARLFNGPVAALRQLDAQQVLAHLDLGDRVAVCGDADTLGDLARLQQREPHVEATDLDRGDRRRQRAPKNRSVGACADEDVGPAVLLARCSGFQRAIEDLVDDFDLCVRFELFGDRVHESGQRLESDDADAYPSSLFDGGSHPQVPGERTFGTQTSFQCSSAFC